MPKEGARGVNGIAIVISTAPDVCKTPMGPNLVPVPYPIVAMFSLATNTKPKVLFAREPAFTKDSFIQQVIGDEAGVGGGVKSGTFKMVAKPIDFSATVRCTKQEVIRNGDKFEMNNGNTTGILIFILMGPAPVSPLGGVDADNNPPIEPETKEEGGFIKGMSDRGGEVWDDVKGMGGTLRDAVGLGDEGSFGKAWSSIWGGTKAVGKLAGNAALAAGGNAIGLGNTEIVNQAEDYLGQIGSAVVDDVVTGYTDAYAEGGWTQAAGRAVADVGKLAVEIVGTKGAGAVIKGAKGAKTAANVVEELGDAAKAIDKIEDATDTAGDLAKTVDKVEDATDTAGDAAKTGNAGGGSGGGASGKPKDKVVVSLTPAQAALKELGPFKGMTRKQIRKKLKEQGYVKQKNGVYTKDLGDGNSVGVRLDSGTNRPPSKFELDKGGYTSQRGTSDSLYADSVPHAHKEIVPTADVANGKYLKPGYKGSTRLNDAGIPSNDPSEIHIPTQK